MDQILDVEGVPIEELIYEYVRDDFELFLCDLQRFDELADFFREKYGDSIQTIVSVGCGSAEEALSFSQKGGFQYVGYDFSISYGTRNPFFIQRELRRHGSPANAMALAEFARDMYGNPRLSFYLNLLVKDDLVTKGIQLKIGREFDATNPALFRQLPDKALILFRHPDIKDHYNITAIMFKNALDTGMPCAMTTSNSMSLFLILQEIRDQFTNKGFVTTSTDVESNDPRFTQLQMEYYGIIKRLGEIQDANTKAKLSNLDSEESYMKHIQKLLELKFTLNDSTYVLKAEYTPQFSRLEDLRSLDSWVITIVRIAK